MSNDEFRIGSPGRQIILTAEQIVSMCKAGTRISNDSDIDVVIYNEPGTIVFDVHGQPVAVAVEGGFRQKMNGKDWSPLISSSELLKLIYGD